MPRDQAHLVVATENSLPLGVVWPQLGASGELGVGGVRADPCSSLLPMLSVSIFIPMSAWLPFGSASSSELSSFS